MGKFLDFYKQYKLKRYINYLLVVIAFIVVSILNSDYVDYIAVNVISAIILAVSLNLVVGFMGELSLGHAGFMCIGAYLGCSLYNVISATSDIGQIGALCLAFAIAGVTATIFGLFVGLPALRLKGDYLAIVTLAANEIVRNVFQRIPGFGGTQGFTIKPFNADLMVIAFIVLLVSLILIQNFINSKHGRAVMSIRDSEIATKAMGINSTKYKLIVFMLAAFFAGIAGVLNCVNSHAASASDMDYNYSIEILVMVVLGGMGSIRGSMIVATLITVMNTLLSNMFTSSGTSSAIKLIVYGLILIIAMILNSSPALKPIKEKLKAHTFASWLASGVRKIFTKKATADIDDSETNDGVSWEVIPTKIHNEDILLSTDFKQDEFAPDKPEGGNK